MVLVARRSVRTRLLALLVVLAALVRVWGLRFGLPHTECRPDESVIVGLAAQFWSGDLNPRFFRYPTLQMYLTAAAFGADFVQGRARGLYSSLSAFREAMIADAPHFHLVARALTVLLGTLTVLAVYRLARAAAGPDTGLVAAFFLSLTYLHARDSHFATTDVPLTFFLTMAVLFVWRAYARGRAADYAWAGALAGLAMSTKYLGLLVAFPLAVAHLARTGATTSPPRPGGAAQAGPLRRVPGPCSSRYPVCGPGVAPARRGRADWMALCPSGYRMVFEAPGLSIPLLALVRARPPRLLPESPARPLPCAARGGRGALAFPLPTAC
jgi:hypothetical protein